MRNDKLGVILKQRRKVMELRLLDIREACGVSESHMGRIENGERYPSAEILSKLAKPLGYQEIEIFRLAGYLTESPEGTPPDKLHKATKHTVGKPMLVNLPAEGYVDSGEGGMAFYFVVKSLLKQKTGRCVCGVGAVATWQRPDACLTRGYDSEKQVDAFLLVGSTTKALVRGEKFSGKYFNAKYSNLTGEGKALFDILKELYGEVDIVTLLDT